MKNYPFHKSKYESGVGEFLEFGIGNPDSIIVNYKIDKHNETSRSVVFIRGKTPSNLKEFYEQTVIPNAPGMFAKSSFKLMIIAENGVL